MHISYYMYDYMNLLKYTIYNTLCDTESFSTLKIVSSLLTHPRYYLDSEIPNYRI